MSLAVQTTLKVHFLNQPANLCSRMNRVSSVPGSVSSLQAVTFTWGTSVLLSQKTLKRSAKWGEHDCDSVGVNIHCMDWVDVYVYVAPRNWSSTWLSRRGIFWWMILSRSWILWVFAAIITSRISQMCIIIVPRSKWFRWTQSVSFRIMKT